MIGKLLGGRYLLLERVGAGGMAVVYRAQCQLLGRTVAVKILREQYASDQQFLQSFQREARAAAALSHPNIVSVFDVGVDEGVHYIVMELVQGRTLKDLVRERGKLPARMALTIGRQIATALGEAHSRGIVHRDIKPQNILLTASGLVKVADFGIARAQMLAEGTLSGPDSVVGSVHYVSPEQARGGEAGPRSDLYSLGVVIYEMLTGKVPFDGVSPVSVALKHVQEAPPPPSVHVPVPPEVEQVVLRALAKDPRDRFPDARSMARAITAAERALPAEDGEIEGEGENEGELSTQVVPTIMPQDRGRGARGWLRAQWFKPALIAAVALILTVTGVLAVRGFQSWVNPPTVQVPSVVGNERAKAVAALEAAGLRVVEGPAENSVEPVGTVIRTEPGALEFVKKGREVRIWTSLGPRFGYVPELSSMEELQAKLTIENYGLAVGNITRRYDRLVPEGKVIDQNPKADIQVPERTAIDLVISKGPEPTKLGMPALVGKHISEAQATIREGKLVEGVVLERESSTYPVGSVMSQTPAANTVVQEGTRVDLEISRGTVVPKKYTHRFEIPLELKGPQEVKTILRVDAKPARCVYWRTHSPGETVSYTIEWVGASARIEVFIGTQRHDLFLPN